jgi:DNA-binding transcriptional LysR family regulator
MRLSLDSIRVLDAIERNNSFASAAEELNRVPSAVTYAINQLEADLGILLFDRSGYRAKLTPAGQELLKEGRALLEQAQALERKIKVSAGLSIPSLSIAYDDALGFDGVKRVLELFLESYPDVSVDLSAEILNGCKDALVSGSADLVVGCFTEVPTEALYRYESLGQIHFIFAVAPQHPLALSQAPLTHKEIAAHRIVVIPDTAKNIPKASSGYAPDRHYLSVSSMESKIQAQAAGLGVGFIPLTLAKPYLEAGLLVQKEVDRPKTNGRCYLAWREDRKNPVLEYIISLFLKHKKELFST